MKLYTKIAAENQTYLAHPSMHSSI